MSASSPFKFLDSYTQEDRDIFFGRDQEIEEVYKKVFQGQTLFIYGESGTGKSSLVSCGLANRFKKSDWLPVNVRRGDNINQSLINELEKISLTRVDNLNGSFAKNLYKYTRSLYLDYFKPVYFIFDQFEELYLMGSREEWREFITGIKTLTEQDINVHFIFIIRSEYLHFLSEFEGELPEVFSNKIRVEKVTRLKARECIEGPCRIFGIAVESDFADRLLDQLSPDSIEIELTYLQVYLDRIYKLANESKEEKLTFSNELLDDIGLVSDVLSDFLDEQINLIEDRDAALTILKAFVTVDGTKRQASAEDVVSFSRSIGKPIGSDQAEALITNLLERRIIKELPDQDKFELRHDALAEKIFEKITIRERELIEVRQFLEYGLSEYKKRKFLLNDKDLAYVEPHLPVLDLSGELEEFVEESIRAAGRKRRARNRVIGIISIIVILSITSIYGFFDAREQRQAALEQKGIAEENAEAAQQQRLIAEQNATLALESQQLAEANADEAARQAEIAEQQRLIAELQRNAADSARIEAEKQRLLALVQKDSAEKARAQALIYLDQANRERANAERLSMQSLARSLGIKSAQLPDVTLKSLLAKQAYDFNREYGGYEYQADIHNALYLAYKAQQGETFNVFKRHPSAVNELIGYENKIYSAGADGLILSWDAELETHEVLDNTGAINYAMDISRDGKFLAVGTSTGIIHMYNLGSNDRIGSKQLHSGRIWDLEFNIHHKLISSGEDGHLAYWQTENGRSGSFLVFEEPPLSIAIKPDNAMIFVGFESGKILGVEDVIITSEPLTGKQIPGAVSLSDKGELPMETVTKISFDQSGELMAIGYETGSVLLVDAKTLNADKPVIQTLPGHTAPVADMKFGKINRFLISAGYDRKNLLWNLDNIKEPPIAWNDHELFALSTTFSPNEKEVITGEINGKMKKYRIDMGIYAAAICDHVDRNLTNQEWQNFVRDDLPYMKTCDNIK